MSIKQFNGEWVAREDRVRFRFNTSEGEDYSFWLTRRIVQGLIAGTQHTTVKTLEKTHAPEVAQAVQAFQQQAVAQQADFQQDYQAATQHPLGEEPLLVVGLVINQQDEQISVEFQLSTGQSVHIQMEQHVVQVMVTLLNKLQGTAQWGVGLLEAAELPVLSAGGIPPVVH
ncbi:hypothetical protein [Limnohabitans sp.]|uniref:hypothetical protein n=1 Tax=Limnohabitans sp. TaxID=1907725 RepID=UPI00286F568B|nr:hypothetical protein [Limnohabitans sp.]